MNYFGPKFLVLQHAKCEGPGIHEQQMVDYGARIHRVEVDAGEELPQSLVSYSGVVVMGGPMGAYETDKYPWLEPELELLAAAVNADMPVWGVCLGAQLLAAALGAHVGPGGSEPEIGVMNVYGSTPAAHDPVFEPAPPEFTVLQWHGDTFELPDGAVKLASSHAFPQQAFRVRNAYGLQFHLEATPEMVAEWGQLEGYADGLQAVHGVSALSALVESWADASPIAHALGEEMFARWLERIVGLPRPSAESDDDEVGSERWSGIL